VRVIDYWGISGCPIAKGKRWGQRKERTKIKMGIVRSAWTFLWVRISCGKYSGPVGVDNIYGPGDVEAALSGQYFVSFIQYNVVVII
jgi:hypothetical protein